MRMMFPQCCGRKNPCFRLATQNANLMKPRDEGRENRASAQTCKGEMQLSNSCMSDAMPPSDTRPDTQSGGLTYVACCRNAAREFDALWKEGKTARLRTHARKRCDSVIRACTTQCHQARHDNTHRARGDIRGLPLQCRAMRAFRVFAVGWLVR